MVERAVPSAAAIRLSLQASPASEASAFNRMRARVNFRAGCLPLRISVSSRSRSVIAHPAPASASPGRLADITNRTVSSTEARLAFAVLTTERKAA